MSNHSSSGPESKYLCERLFEELEKRLGPLLYRHGQDMCTVRTETGILAWVTSHAQAYGSINVWFRGSGGHTKNLRALHICTHSKSNLYGGSFKIRNDEQLLEAAGFLSNLSSAKARHSPMNFRIKAPAKMDCETKHPDPVPGHDRSLNKSNGFSPILFSQTCHL
jgi:hypothetical protein